MPRGFRSSSLPFANLSGDPGQDYLVDALTDQLTTSSRAPSRHFRHRSQHRHDLQGQAGRRQGDRQGSGCALCPRRLGAAERRSDEGQRPAHRRRAAALTSGPNNLTRPAPIYCRRRTRSSRIWRAHSTFSSTEAEAARLNRTPAANRDAEDLALQCNAGQWKAGCDRQGGGCGLRALRTGARHRSQQCPRPAGVGGQVLVAGGAWLFQRP